MTLGEEAKLLDDVKSLNKNPLKLIERGGLIGRFIAKRLNETFRTMLVNSLDPGKDKELINVISSLDDINIKEYKENTVHEVLDAVLKPRLKQDKVLLKQYEKLLNRFPAHVRLENLLRLNRPIETHPFFKDVLNRSITKRIFKIVGKDADKQWLERIDSSTQFNGDFWKEAVKDGLLTPEEAEDIHNAFLITSFTGDNFELTAALRKQGIKTPEDPVTLQREDWLAIIKENNIAVPAAFKGENAVEEYARYLTNFTEKIFPTKVFIQRLRVKKKNKEQLMDEITALEEYKKLNPGFTLKSKGKITPGDGTITTPDKEIMSQIDSLTKTVNIYQSEDIINNDQLTVEQKAEAIESRMLAYDQFISQNDIELLTVDFFAPTTKNTLNWEGVSEEDQAAVTRIALTSQRMLRITADTEIAVALQENGIDSAQYIANLSKAQFTAQYQDELELNENEMSDIYNKSKGIATNAQFQYLNLVDVVDASYWNGVMVNNTNDDIEEYYQSIPSYQELFGTLSYCNCTLCRSIFGPAAYFVDLMRFVDTYITENTTNDIHETLQLKNRRPDLWEIPLDCKNTNTLMPYLDLVLEVLEKKLGATEYDPNIPYITVFEAKHPVNLPFNLPLEKIRLFLQHFATTLYAIYEAFEKDTLYIAGEFLNISNEERSILIDSSEDSLVDYYRVSDMNAPDFGGLNKVQTFIYHLDITRTELDELLYQNLDGSEDEADTELGQKLHHEFYINNVDSSAAPVTINYQSDEPELENLDNPRLARIHRFIRLAKKLAWSFQDLDWILTSLGVDGSNDIVDDTIAKLGLVREWQEKFDLSLEVLSSFWYKIKDIGKRNDEGDEPRDLFNRVFNHPNLLETGEELVPDGSVNISLTDSEDENRSRLLAALEITDEELNLLLDTQRLPASIYVDGSNELALTEESLAHLYRTAKLFKALGISLEEFYILLDLLGITGYDNFENLEIIIDTVDWLKQYNFSAHELQYMISGELNDYVEAGYTDEDVRLLTEECDLSDTYISAADFLAIEGLTEEQAAALYEELVNNGFIEDSQEGGKLLPAYTPEDESFTLSLTGEYGSEDIQDQVITILNQFDQKQVIMEKLGVFFDQSPSLVGKIMEFASQSLDDPDFVALMAAPLQEEEEIPEEISTFLRALHNRAFITDKLGLDQKELELLLETPGYFAVSDPANLVLADIQGLSYYYSFTNEYNDTEHQLLEYFETDDLSEKKSLLAEITGFDPSQLQELAKEFWPDAADKGYENINGLMKLKECFDISTYLGVNISTLKKWSQLTRGGWEDWAAYNDVANTLLETLKAKYGEDEWEEKYAPINDQVLKARRTALASYAVWQIDVSWSEDIAPVEDFNDLYEYLLIDVEMSSCAEISRIKQGIATLQLYIQRCLMNLEPGVLPESIDADIWEWMKNYRVWEANRKVFLYPENYLEPELRDDKSPIFEELENELLQQETNDDNVEMIYRNYLTKLGEMTTLRIAGNYYLYAGEDTILYLFGRTNSQPPTYYYRQYMNNSTWTPWKKIDIAIKAEKVSATYAFNRLFLFWTEVKNVPGEQEGEKVNKASIYFSYLNMSDKWGQPQGLIEEEEIGSTDGWTMVYPEFDGDKIIVHYGLLEEIDERGNYELYPNFAYESTELSYFTDATTYVPYPVYCWTSPVLIEELEDIDRGNYFHSVSNLIESDVAYCVAGEDVGILQELEFTISEVQAVNAKENWYIFFCGDEEFLMKRNSGTSSNIQPGKIDSKPVDDIIFLGRTPGAAAVATSKAVENPEILDPGEGLTDKVTEVGTTIFSNQYNFTRLSTNTIHEFSKILFADGLDGLLSIESQQISEPDFERLKPGSKVGVKPYSGDILDFAGPYGPYFKEIFFHIPFLIANTLNTNQKFEAAQQWYHYIFNPTTATAEQGLDENDRFWQYIPFRGLGIETLEDMLTDEAAIEVYEQDPFNPYAIARLRLYTFQKAIVMKYIDNLLDWGDYLFAQDTWESITEATMLYVMASNLLGKKPEELPDCKPDETFTYTDIYEKYGSGEDIPQFLVELENTGAATYAGYGSYSMNSNAYYFCIPENDQFIDYWEQVEDRLYKIRNCMNISGEVRQLALFQPPINPMALVRAAASGRDIASVLSEAYSPVPYYRFTYMIEKTKGLISVVQQFGGALLSALEKKDAEELALLRSTHEKTLLDLTTGIKEKQIEEIQENLNSLDASLENAKLRETHYKGLIDDELLPAESAQIGLEVASMVARGSAFVGSIVASILHLVPNVGAPTAVTFGGIQLGENQIDLAKALDYTAALFSQGSGLSAIIGHNKRREQEWELQEEMASHDVTRIEAQIKASGLRKEMLEKELDVHEKSIEQKEEEYNFLKEKFTNQELYQWMVSQLASLYFQAYKMAYEFAKAAEKAYQFERHTQDTYINFGHWDGLKKGLLSGERLSLELNQLEKAHIEGNKRELEIDKTISLAQLNPLALYDLKETGSCEFDLGEELFARDFPGQYCRRIKTISLSIPAVLGPYENIKATLMQTNNKILLEPDTSSGSESALQFSGNIIELNSENDKVRSNWRMNEKIAVSRGVNDSGMFELNFRDERYLPFEGSGAVSSWKLEMLKGSNDFDFDTISDVIIHLKYTALYDGGLREHIFENYTSTDGYRLLSLRHEFSTEWYHFMEPGSGAENHELTFTLSEKTFPLNLTNLTISELSAKLVLENLEPSEVSSLSLEVTANEAGVDNLEFTNSDLATAAVTDGDKAFGDWSIKINRAEIPGDLRKKDEDDNDKTEEIGNETCYFLDPEKIKNLVLIVTFEGEMNWPES